MPAGSSLAARHRRVGDLVDLARPLTARSVLASALLGARQPRLPVADLVAAASLLGITSGATRTCLWRMVANGELTADDGTYALAGRLLERRHRVDDAARAAYVLPRWDGTWELAVVAPGRRPALDRLELRRAAGALHLAQLREGVWLRPDNLAADRLPAARAVVSEQCVQFRRATVEMGDADLDGLFALDSWAATTRRLTTAVVTELDAGLPGDGDASDVLTFRFLLSVAVVRHLQLDPYLPAELLPPDWPADDLRRQYAAFDAAFKRSLATRR